MCFCDLSQMIHAKAKQPAIDVTVQKLPLVLETQHPSLSDDKVLAYRCRELFSLPPPVPLPHLHSSPSLPPHAGNYVTHRRAFQERGMWRKTVMESWVDGETKRDGSVGECKIETGRGREFVSGPPPFCPPPPFIIPIHSLTFFHSSSIKVVDKDGLATFWPGIGCHSRAEL